MRGPIALLLLGVAVAAGGCGDSDESGESSKRAVAEPSADTASATAERRRDKRATRDRRSTHSAESRRAEKPRRSGPAGRTARRAAPVPAPPELRDYELGPVPENPRAGGPPPPPGRAAPASRAGPLRFTRVRVFRDAATGRTAVRANTTNRGKRYLNSLRIRWRLVSAGGAVLDSGATSWPTLAPGETAAVPFRGSRKLSSGWSRVVFRLAG